MCGKLNCSIWMLSKWNYFGDVVGEGVEAIKNNHRGLWGRHWHTSQCFTAAWDFLDCCWNRCIISALTSPDKVCGLLTSPSMPTTTEEPSWDLHTAVKRASQLAHKICDCCMTVPAPLWPAVLRTCCTLCTGRNWFVPITVWTLHCMTFMCSAPSRKH